MKRIFSKIVISSLIAFTILGCSFALYSNRNKSNVGAYQSISGLTSATGGSITNMAITDVLYVSPDGNGSDGGTWTRAYTTIQDALDAASTDVNDNTLIMIAPTDTYYDINTTGDPTWSANVVLMGSHRSWVEVRNDHASATSIMKLTGNASINNLSFNLGTDNNGIIFAESFGRASRLQFDASSLTSAGTAMEIGNGSTIVYWGNFTDIKILGNTTYATAVKFNKSRYAFIQELEIANCLAGVQYVDSDCDLNVVHHTGIDACTIGIDIDAGNMQYFEDVRFNANTINIDDEVGDHNYNRIFGSFPTTITDGLSGTTVTAGAGAETYGADTEIRAAASSTKPFRVTGYLLDPAANENYKVRLSADSGSTYFAEISVVGGQFNDPTVGTGTDFIFNPSTRISASAQSESGSNNIAVWLEIQEI